MITKYYIRHLTLLALLLLVISVFTQVPATIKNLKRAGLGTSAGMAAYTRSTSLLIYDPATLKESVLATNIGVSGYNFSWGGDKIAYNDNNTVSSHIYTVPINGSSRPFDTGATGIVSSISADGSKIAYLTYTGTLGLMNSDGSNKTGDAKIFPIGYWMRWVPNSNVEISYINNLNKIAKYNINTHVVIEYPLHAKINVDNSPSDFFWKPDGSAFVYSDERNNVYIHTVAPASDVLITEAPSSTVPMLKWQPNGNNASYLVPAGLEQYNPVNATYVPDIKAFASSFGFDWVQDSKNIIYSAADTSLSIYDSSTGISTQLKKNDVAAGITVISGVVMPQWIAVTASSAVTSVVPNTVIDNQGVIKIALKGRGFPTTPRIKLTSSINSYPASSILASSATDIIFSINASTLPPGIYSVDVLSFDSILLTSAVDGLTVVHANLAPIVTPYPGPDIVVNEDSGPYSYNVTITPGGPLDAGQKLQIFPSTDNIALIGGISIESLNSSGLYKVTITPAADKSGVANITVKIKDDGGTLNGGVDTTTESFKYTVNPVNDSPKIDPITDVTVLNSNQKTIIIAGASPGPADEATQTLSFTAASSNPTFLPDPAISKNVTSGNYEILLKPVTVAASTTAKITITVKDSGGTANGGVDTFVTSFNYTVNPINIAPKFNTIADAVILEDGTLNISVSGLTAGNAAEDALPQLIDVTAASNNTSLITPTITQIAGGFKITGTPVANKNGTAQITVTAKDNGGVANGGVDQYSQTFKITVTAVNDTPGFDHINDVVTTNNLPVVINITGANAGGNGTETDQTLTFTVSNYDTTLVASATIANIGGVWEMTITPVTDAIGVTNIDVKVTDDGGTANGAINFYIQKVKFTHDQINTPPTFDPISDQIMNEDGTLNLTISYTLGSGALEAATQQVAFTVTSDNLSLIEQITLVKTLTSLNMTFTPKPDANGTAVITIKAVDDGGTANGGTDTTQKSFNITVNPVNDPPVAAIPTIDTVSGDGVEHSFLITGISVGPANESTQTIASITASTDTTPLLTALRATGSGDTRTIFYTPVDGQSGAGNIIITIKDNGGVLNSGVDTKVYNVPISILSKPNLPIFISPIDGDYTSGDDTIKVKGTATSSKIRYSIAKQIDVLSQTRVLQWVEIANSTTFSNSGDTVSVEIPALNILPSGQWKLRVTAEDERGGKTDGTPIVVTVPAIMPPAIVENSLILFGMPVNSPDSLIQLPAGIKMATYNTAANSYSIFTTPAASTFNNESGYWIRSDTVNAKLKFTGSITSLNKSIPLSVGWNLISNPYIGDIQWSWDNIIVFDPGTGATKSIQNAADVILPYAWTFVSNNTEAQHGHYSLVFDNTVLPGINHTIAPWNGFWVKALKPCNIIIPNSNPSVPKERSAKRSLLNGWSTRIIANSDNGSAEVVIGVCDVSRNLLMAAPPSSLLGSAVKIAASRNGNQLSADFITGEQNKEWTLVISKDDATGGNVVLNWPDLSSFNGKRAITLTDAVTGKRVLLNEVRSYTVKFAPGETTRTIKLAVAKRTASPLQITNIRADNSRSGGQVTFDLSSPATVTLTVRNMVGKFITAVTLDAQSAGTQTMGWNAAGKSAGKYLIELKAADKDGRSIRAASIISIK